MKLILKAFIITLALSGCGPKQTTHDYCMEHIQNYANYEECYSENHNRLSTGRKILLGFSRGLQGAGQGLQNASQQQTPQPINCYPNYAGGYHCQ